MIEENLLKTIVYHVTLSQGFRKESRLFNTKNRKGFILPGASFSRRFLPEQAQWFEVINDGINLQGKELWGIVTECTDVFNVSKAAQNSYWDVHK